MFSFKFCDTFKGLYSVLYSGQYIQDWINRSCNFFLPGGKEHLLDLLRGVSYEINFDFQKEVEHIEVIEQPTIKGKEKT